MLKRNASTNMDKTNLRFPKYYPKIGGLDLERALSGHRKYIGHIITRQGRPQLRIERSVTLCNKRPKKDLVENHMEEDVMK